MNMIESQKGSDVISYERFLYHKDKAKKNTQNWRCAIKNCRATLKAQLNYKENSEGTLGQEHNRAADPAR